jgi:UDP-arabinose 4-epimerase
MSKQANVLITGGAGFIGSHTCKALAAQSFLPFTFDNLARGHAELVRWGPLVRGDILEQAALDAAFERYRPACVIHFAGLAYVGESLSRPLDYYRTNVSGLINVIDAMRRHRVNAIVFSSSCATYGIPDSFPIQESAEQRPINPYGRSKLACERILMDVSAAGGLRVALLRYFNAAGADPDGDLAERHDPETHLIPLAINAALGRGPPLSILGDDYPTRDGTCERDFIDVSDLASGHDASLVRTREVYPVRVLNQEEVSAFFRSSAYERSIEQYFI